MAILFSRLIAFVEYCVAVQANRIGSKTMTLEQGIRYLSREEEVRHITGRLVNLPVERGHAREEEVRHITGRPRIVVKRLIFHEKEAQT